MNIHEEALKIARNLMKKDPSLADWVISKFPELRESEGGKIRKSLISYLSNIQGLSSLEYNYGITTKEAIAWLEKQSEQKPADKVEPKFHEGEWVVYEYGEETATLQITRIVEETYVFSDDSTLDVVDEDTLRLWDIAKDAKNGDVLATELFIFIFKNIDDGNGVHYYCHYEINKHEDDEQFGVALPQSLMGRVGNSITHYSPATKEQRDTLMKAMTDAGYIFDFEKKELKKVEQKSAEWSEEDESYLNTTIAYLKDAKEFKKTAENCINWLKSLKDRVQSKVEWSKENEEKIDFLTNLIRFQVKDSKYSFGYGATVTYVTKEEAVDMLHSLRPQKQWKPSDEQIYWIGWVVHRLPDTEKANEAEAVLKELLEQLKKLT